MGYWQICWQSEPTNMFVYLYNIIVTRRDQAEREKCVKSFPEAAQCQKLTLNDSKPILSTNKISMLGYEILDGLVRPDKLRQQPLLDWEIPNKKHHLKEF